MLVSVNYKATIEIELGDNRSISKCVMELNADDGNWYNVVVGSHIYLYNRQEDSSTQSASSTNLLDLRVGYKIRLPG